MMERFVLLVPIQRIPPGGTMSKARKEVPELTDEELAFEMLEITCDEMNSLAKAFDMISNLCKELNGEEVAAEEAEEAEEAQEIPSGAAIH
jgi:hypothetical protein